MAALVVAATPAGVRGAPATTRPIAAVTNIIILQVSSHTNAASRPTVTTHCVSTPTATDG